MGIDVVSKFLKVSGENPVARNDNDTSVAFTADEKNYIMDLLGKYGLASRAYEDNEGERVDIFFNRMAQQYNLPSITLTKRSEERDGSPYKFMTSGPNGFLIPSNGFSSMQSTLSGFLMKHFQNQKVRALDI